MSYNNDNNSQINRKITVVDTDRLYVLFKICLCFDSWKKKLGILEEVLKAEMQTVHPKQHLKYQTGKLLTLMVYMDFDLKNLPLFPADW